MSIFGNKKQPATLTVVEVRVFAKLVKRLQDSDVYGFKGTEGTARIATMCGFKDVEEFNKVLAEAL